MQHIIRPDKVNDMMRIAGFNETTRRSPYPIDLWPDTKRDQRSNEDWFRVRKIAFKEGKSYQRRET